MNIQQTTTQNHQGEKKLPPSIMVNKVSSLLPQILTYLPSLERSTVGVLYERIPSSTETGHLAHTLMEEVKELEKREQFQEVNDWISDQTDEQKLLLDEFKNARSKSRRRELIIQFCLGLSDAQAQRPIPSLTYSSVRLEISLALEIRKAFLIEDPAARKNALTSIAEKTRGSSTLLQSASFFYKKEEFQKNLEILQVIHKELENGEFFIRNPLFPISRDTLLTLIPLLAENNIPEIRKIFNGASNQGKRDILGFVIDSRRTDLAVECLPQIGSLEGIDNMHKYRLCLLLIQLGTKDAIAFIRTIVPTISDVYCQKELCLDLIELGMPDATTLAKEIAPAMSSDHDKDLLCLGLIILGTEDAMALAQEVAPTISDDGLKVKICWRLIKLNTPSAIGLLKKVAPTISNDFDKDTLYPKLLELDLPEVILKMLPKNSLFFLIANAPIFIRAYTQVFLTRKFSQRV